jgi:hypothetical protein
MEVEAGNIHTCGIEKDEVIDNIANGLNTKDHREGIRPFSRTPG